MVVQYTTGKLLRDERVFIVNENWTDKTTAGRRLSGSRGRLKLNVVPRGGDVFVLRSRQQRFLSTANVVRKWNC